MSTIVITAFVTATTNYVCYYFSYDSGFRNARHRVQGLLFMQEFSAAGRLVLLMLGQGGRELGFRSKLFFYDLGCRLLWV